MEKENLNEKNQSCYGTTSTNKQRIKDYSKKC